jgi:hypothetical protein
MSDKNPVTVAELSQKIVRSYGFFCLVNEGKKISVITDNERSMDMIVDYILEGILQKIASQNASLN